MSKAKIPLELINQHGRSEKLEIRNDASICILELVEETGVPSPFGCRVGSCGTCVVEVMQGGEFLIPRTQIEADTLSRVAPELPNARLICRATLKPDLATSGAEDKLILRKIRIV